MATEKLSPQAYTDINGLAALKLGAKAQTPAALREAARQFESIFTRMMLKTMREASGGDELFDSQQSGFYRDMFDDQISVDMSRGHGLGLADQLVAQMLRAGIVSSPDAQAAATDTSPPTTKNWTAKDPQDFVRELLPSAVAAGRELGVDPRSLLAHAALETAWGKAMPAAANGRGSNNLFGVKAGAAWKGGSVGSSTVEFDQGVAQQRTERFRAYATPAASFQDYVTLLRDNPRYAAALGQGSDATGFANALQNAGYATDPRYAQKLLAVTRQVRDVVDDFLKGGSLMPIATAETGSMSSHRPSLQLEPIDG